MKKKLLVGLLMAPLFALGLRAQNVTTVVTNQVNGLNEPYGIAVDAQDNFYITDSANHRIARFKTENGELVTFAGKFGEFGSANGTLATARFFDPHGIVFARGGLVVADSGNHAIRFIDLNTKAVTTIAGTLGRSGSADGPGATALFRSPRGITADAAGNIFVADSRNRAVRKIDPNNQVTTINSTAFLSPAGLALGDNGELYVSDRGDHSIKKLEQNGFVTPFAGTPGTPGTNDATSAVQASFNSPEDILWLGPTFGLLVADSENNILRRVRYDTNVLDNVVDTYAGTPGFSGHVDSALSTSLFDLPTGLVRYSTGFLVVDSGNGVIRQILTSPQQPRTADPVIGTITIVVDQESGKSKTKLIPVTEETFNDSVTIGVLSERGVRTFFTSGPSRTNVFQPDPIPDPTAASNTAPDYQDGLDPANMPPSLTPPLPDLTVKAVSMAEGRTSSRIVTSIFHFQVATPAIDATSAGSVTVRDITTDALIFYTLDGSDPTESTLQNPASQGPKSNGDKIPITIGKTNLIFKAKAFRANFKPSQVASVELSATNFTPNRISFGFAGGEASSDFAAAAGQRFYAPITLTTVPAQTMYGLQFNVTLREGTGPAPVNNSAYSMSFQTMLMELLVDIYRPIPPQAFVGVQTNITTFGTGTNTFTITNTVNIFTNLVFTNVTQNILGVGWVERKGYGELYNTGLQDLIKYSIAHDTVFNSANNKIVVGGFSFVVPSTARVDDTYLIQIGRPSATEDGVASDVFIEAPDGTDPRVPVKARQTVRVVNRRPYIVGDLAPFRWMNAGDFGDTNILNNDITQVFQATSRSLNLPPVGSDFEDAIDSCCISTNNVDLSTTSDFFNGSETTINTIGFGDGRMNVADLFVTFRRALDPSLAWYARFWSNGVRQAMVVSNVFRGSSTTEVPLTRQSLEQKSNVTGDSPSVAFWAENIPVTPGQTAIVPIRANLTGGYPLKVLMLNMKVLPIDGAPAPASRVKFVPSAQLGAPTINGESTFEFTSAAWLDASKPGVSGNVILGTLEFQVPANAPANSAYYVSFEHASGSPNGIAIYPQILYDGLVVMAGRTAQSFNDGIPDSWRAKYFNSLLNWLSAAAADGDGDGISNAEEYRNGTNPTMSDTPQFRLSASSSASQGITLKWPSLNGKIYILERSSSILEPAWTVIASDIIGTGSTVQYTDLPSGQATQFYRVRLSP